MATALPGTAFHSTPFIRLLADLADAQPAPPARGPASGPAPGAAPGPAPGLADTLAGWLNWTDAIALSAALNSAAPALLAGAAASSAAMAGAERDHDRAHSAAALQRAVAQVRDALALAVRHDPVLGAAATARRLPQRGPAVLADPGDDPVARLQRCHVNHQRAMDAQLGPLRNQLRAALARQSPALARLAALDAALDQALAVRERHLLGQVPGLVARPAQRQRAGALVTDADPQNFKRLQARWQALLLAELDSRMQPIEGLLAALQQATAGPHAPLAPNTPQAPPAQPAAAAAAAMAAAPAVGALP